MQKILEDLEKTEIREQLQREAIEAREEDDRERKRRRAKRCGVDKRRQALLGQRY